MSEQLLSSGIPLLKLIQCEGGFGRTSGDGGSLNLDPAYAFPCGDGDLERLAFAGRVGEILSASKGGFSLGCTGLHLKQCSKFIQY